MKKWPSGAPDIRRMVLIGGGTGLAPFISYSLYLKATWKQTGNCSFTWSKICDELIYRDLLTKLEDES